MRYVGNIVDFTPIFFVGCLNSTPELGMARGTIPDSDITASSMINSYSEPYFARLGNSKAWSADRKDLNPWIQVNLQKAINITDIATQGFTGSYVRQYYLSYSVSGNQWTNYTTQGVTKVSLLLGCYSCMFQKMSLYLHVQCSSHSWCVSVGSLFPDDLINFSSDRLHSHHTSLDLMNVNIIIIYKCTVRGCTLYLNGSPYKAHQSHTVYACSTSSKKQLKINYCYNNYTLFIMLIRNSNRTEWSTIQGVIG